MRKKIFSWKKSKEIIEKILISPVFISLMVFLVVALIVYRLTITKVDSAYDKEFIRDVLVEAHGMLFDILIIGTFIFALHTLVESRREKKRNIKRWQDEIDDYIGWDEKEATFRIIGNIKRLNNNNVTDIDLSNSFLKNAIFWGTDLWGTDLWGTDLWGTDLRGANLEEASLFEANLEGAKLWSARLVIADFLEADLKGADLSVANLSGAINLTIEQLSKVKTLYQATLDPELEKEVKEKYPHLLERPEWLEKWR